MIDSDGYPGQRDLRIERFPRLALEAAMARTASYSPTSAQHVRQPAVAGTFYPSNPDALLAMATCMLDAGEANVPAAIRQETVRALIAPHAGYAYSGPIAGSAFAAVRARRGQVRRVVNIGPSHYIAFEGVAAPDPKTTSFATPLGEVALDRAAMEEVLQMHDIVALDAAHQREHSLETHLPFLQITLHKFAYVPMVFSKIEPDTIASVLDRLWNEETLIVISSDLSHYLDYAAAKRMDRATADAIEQLSPQNIAVHQACGRLAIQALLQCARQRGWSAHTLDLRNSGDTAGADPAGRDRVVGYGAFALV